MYFVYILKSNTAGRYYIGMTSDIDKRIQAHNRGKNKSTKFGKPWRIVYKEKLLNKQEAWRREKQIKRYKNGEAFKRLIIPG